MTYTNQAMLIRRELLSRIAKLYFEGTLLSEIDRIPIEMSPKRGNTSRCCVYKERAVLKYRIMALLGYDIADETDELTRLSEYAEKALNKLEVSQKVLTVIDEACSSCVKNNYIVTNLCQGCLGRPCQLNCPKGCISMVNGRAHIDTEKCVNCGLCKKACPYHAIVFMPVPCEAACPVNAIQKNDDGIEYIDTEKCIHCGRCMTACPFGAIREQSQFINILKAIKSEKKVVALVAPAILGQFKDDITKVYASLKEIGFDEIAEVAEGAIETVKHEVDELKEKLEEGQKFMTTSCCPAYTEYTKKHLPEIQKFVSSTPSPMHYSAKKVKDEDSNAISVFVGPCTAKRKEAMDNPYVDYVMTFEEFGALLIAKGIQIANVQESVEETPDIETGRWFAKSGGVTKAINHKHDLKDDYVIVNGLNKANIRQLKTFAKGKCPASFVEVMACEGGCIAGPGILNNPQAAERQLNKRFK
ncbi:MAG: 4Fe-4S dicluster domain-containing protein [Bacteroidales bacterium]